MIHRSQTQRARRQASRVDSAAARMGRGADAVRSRRTTVRLRVGDEWMTHRVLAELDGSGPTDCDGTLHFVAVLPLVEAACDGCSFVIGGRPHEVRRTLETREEPWYQR